MVATLEAKPIVSISTTTELKRLGTILDDLDIPVYPAEQVQAFKENFRQKLIRQTTLKCIFWGMFYGAGAWAYGWVLSVLPSASSSPYMTIPLFVGWVMSAIVFLLCNVIYSAAIAASVFCRREIKWKSREVGRVYLSSKGIPEEIALLGSRVQSQNFGITCRVEYLEKDPFLWVSLRDEEYCIAHWDEPFVDK